MTVFPVKQSVLLRQPEHLFEQNEIQMLIQKMTDNLIHIEDKTGEFLLRLDDGRIIDTKGWNGWEWTHGIALYGIYHYYQQTGDQQMKAIVDTWFAERLAEGTPTKNVNTMCPFLTLAYLYQEKPNPVWLQYLECWADWVMYEMPRTEKRGLQHIVYNNENKQQMWDDTLMMSVIPLAKIGVLLGNQDYINEAKYQFMLHTQYLMDRQTGLWFHGWSFDKKSNFARARWARGNSWITIAIPEFLELLESAPDPVLQPYLIQVLESQVEALASLQDRSGLWHTLLDDTDSYLESSATAGFAYGILKAVRKRYLDRKYLPVAEKAIKGVVQRINMSGELTQVSFGTAMGDSLNYYKNIPLTSMPYGQAMAILCLTEYLHTFI